MRAILAVLVISFALVALPGCGLAPAYPGPSFPVEPPPPLPPVEPPPVEPVPPPPPVEPVPPPEDAAVAALLARIEIGMTDAQVRAIVGGAVQAPPHPPGQSYMLRWRFTTTLLWVAFSSDEKVIDKGTSRIEVVPPR